MQKRIRIGKLERLQQQLTAKSAWERLQWAEAMFGPKAVATACLGADCAVMLHMLAQACPQSPVFVIAGGGLSQEAQAAVAAMEERLGLRVRLLDLYAPTTAGDQPAGDQPAGGAGPDGGAGLAAALDEAFCWISDSRRHQAFAPGELAVLERLHDGLYQLNPLFDWPAEALEAYREQYNLPRPEHAGWRAAAQGSSAWVAQHAAR